MRAECPVTMYVDFCFLKKANICLSILLIKCENEIMFFFHCLKVHYAIYLQAVNKQQFSFRKNVTPLTRFNHRIFCTIKQLNGWGKQDQVHLVKRTN